MRYVKLAHLVAAAALLLLLPSVAAAQVPAMPGTPPAPSTSPPAPVAVQPLPAAPGLAPPPARWTTTQVREAFDLADSNSNGELTRAESQQLRILPRSFEDMDQNKNGVLERSEYESGVFR